MHTDRNFDLQRFSQEAGPEVPGEAQTPDAGARENQTPSFDSLLKENPHYKAACDARIRKAVEGRIRDYKAMEARQERMAPLLEALTRRYGSEDVEALTRAVSEDQPRQTRQQTLEAFRAQVAATRKRFPAFRLGKEMENPAFGKLVAKGVPMEEAYRLSHQNEALLEAMGYAIGRTRQALSDQLLAGSGRPPENALGSRASAPGPQDPRSLTAQQRKALRSRVARGEKVYW